MLNNAKGKTSRGNCCHLQGLYILFICMLRQSTTFLFETTFTVVGLRWCCLSYIIIIIMNSSGRDKGRHSSIDDNINWNSRAPKQTSNQSQCLAYHPLNGTLFSLNVVVVVQISKVCVWYFSLILLIHILFLVFVIVRRMTRFLKMNEWMNILHSV